MRYISTRGQAPDLSFEQAILTGLAADGGLYVPDKLPSFNNDEIVSWQQLNYQELMFVIVQPFVEGEIEDVELKQIIAKSYAGFRHAAIAPLAQTAHNEWILELFHGPTLAFKDFALQFLGHLLDSILAKREQKLVVLGATSGDTGSAAIEGCRNCENVDIFILHPWQRVSDVQRRQMTTVISDNVFNIAVKGNFDDCQNLVKRSFNDQSFLSDGRQLIAVNSINWARIMAQIVYYFYAALALGGPSRPISFSVPTGNFGDIFAGYLARQMGLPIDQLIIATNQNDILHRCLSANDHSKHELVHSISPSMDIMVSSNFERLLFDLYERDGEAVGNLLTKFDSGAMLLSEAALSKARNIFTSSRLDDEQTLATMRSLYQSSAYAADPHTAIGVAAARECRSNQTIPVVCLATAHPSKFPQAAEQALPATAYQLPSHLNDLMAREERYEVIDNSPSELHDYMRQKLG